MKVENIIGIIGTILIVILITYFSYDYFDNQKNINQTINNLNIQTNSINGTTQITGENINTHNVTNDCWLIIDNKVYDITNYLRLHPGGQAIIVPYCGGEATAAFSNKGGEGSHSQLAIEQLGGLYIGDYNSQTGLVNVLANTNTETIVNTETSTNTPPTNTTTNTLSLTTQLVAGHNSSNDCWIIINNNVYGVTNYLRSHPGGSNIIIPYCGGDATQAFATRGGGSSHSSFASSQLGNYLIGSIGSETTTTQIQQTQQNINQIIPSTSVQESEDEKEEEDDD